MTKNETKPLSLSQLRQYNTNRILTNNFNPTTLNVKVASNPYLKDQEKYHYLIYKLNDYNRRVTNNQVNDHYEALYYERLHSVVCDIAFLETKVDQITRLEETFKWAKEQEHLITQRLNQGEIRYQVTKQVRNGVEPEIKDIHVSQKTHVEELPSQTVAKAQLPFKKGWRTTHKELDIPARRLNEYKRKILNIAPFIEPKQEKKAPKVTYPKIPKLQYKQQEPEEAQQPQEGQQGGQQPPQDGSAPAVPGEVKQGEVKQGEEAPNPADQQQDLGGFGQQPAEPQQQEPPEETNDDKLAPKLKSYVLEYKDIKRKQYKGPYMFYKGEQSDIERRMEQKYFKIFNDQIKKQKQDKEAIQVAEEWAARKAKMQKEHQKRLQNSLFAAKYNLSFEEPPKPETLASADELRFGFTENLRRPKMAEIQLNSAYLPKIGQEKLYEKSIRKDRINSLKSKFGKLLNLQQFQQREVNQSLCQYSSRKRGLSQIIRNHSKSKERINQLDEVVRIKQKLARNKVGIDVRSLSMGLCVPEDEESTNQSAFPDKALPSNPFMVQTKKKKKKK